MLSHSTSPDWSPTVQVNIKHLIDDVQCYQTVRLCTCILRIIR